MDRNAAVAGENLIQHVGELHIVSIARDAADMRRTDHVAPAQQRMAAVAQRLDVEDIDRRHAGPPRVQGGFGRARHVRPVRLVPTGGAVGFVVRRSSVPTGSARGST